jgi:uncharacterized protein (DUF4213/DUF364 family)
MKILEDLISLLDFKITVKDIRQGVFHTGVLTRYCGLAATLPRDALREDPPLVRQPCSLLDIDICELARMAYSDRLLEAAIGMATINSLLEVEEKNCLELNAQDLITEKGKGKRVAIIGHFPFIPDLREKAKELWVIEKNPREGDFLEEETGNLLPNAHVVGITGTALTNHTMERLLELCDPGAFVVVLGDSAPLSPVLFDYGVDAICGTKVINSEIALRCVSQGANFRQIRGLRRLTMLKR